MEIHIGERVAQVELLSKEGNKVSVLLDGKQYDLDVAMLEEGVYSVIKDGESYSIEVNRLPERKAYRVNSRFASFETRIVDTQEKYLRLKRGEGEKQQEKLLAPMPGRVVKIPVSVGQELKAGDTVMVLEAMKMQNSYTVSEDCRVKEILVQEGEAVKNDQVLMSFTLTSAE